MNEKKLLKIVLGILIALFLHNLYLNYQLSQVKEDAERARRYASNAEDYAREAADYAQDASNAAFANNCRYCP